MGSPLCRVRRLMNRVVVAGELSVAYVEEGASGAEPVVLLRHRLGLAPGSPRHGDLERRLALLPPISVPTITLDGTADGNFPATDGSDHARFFTGPREHRTVPAAGHNLPAEAPMDFAAAVLDVAEPPGDGAGTP